MVYGYSRVSTREQAKDGNSLEAQGKALKDAGHWKYFQMHWHLHSLSGI